MNRALSRFELGDILGAQSDAQEVKRLDKNLARVRELLFAKILYNAFNEPKSMKLSVLTDSYLCRWDNQIARGWGAIFFSRHWKFSICYCYFHQIGRN